MKILIADDEDATRLKLETLLTKLGYDVLVARDGVEAWEMLQREDAPRLALLDWLMPGIDGVEVCRRVRQEGGPYVYIVMLTVRGQKRDLVAGMDAGADDYLSKPFNAEELRVRLSAGMRILKLQEELRVLATHDDLTGVLNRGTIIGILERELAHVERKGVPVSIALADMDDFKQVNDMHGHAIGDAVLREAASRIGRPMRPYDALGRYGGEEFLIVLPGCGMSSALLIGERVRCAVGNSAIDTAAGPISMTVSIGIASVEKGQESRVDELIQTADEALYRAKRGGRNRVERPVKH